MTYEITLRPDLIEKLDALCDRRERLRAKRGERRPTREELMVDLIENEHARWCRDERRNGGETVSNGVRMSGMRNVAFVDDFEDGAPPRIVLSHDLPVVCAACHRPMVKGHAVILVVIGPGDDPEARSLCRTGRPYTALTVPAHAACVTGIVE